MWKIAISRFGFHPSGGSTLGRTDVLTKRVGYPPSYHEYGIRYYTLFDDVVKSYRPDQISIVPRPMDLFNTVGIDEPVPFVISVGEKSIYQTKGYVGVLEVKYPHLYHPPNGQETRIYYMTMDFPPGTIIDDTFPLSLGLYQQYG